MVLNLHGYPSARWVSCICANHKEDSMKFSLPGPVKLAVVTLVIGSLFVCEVAYAQAPVVTINPRKKKTSARSVDENIGVFSGAIRERV